VRKSQGCNYVSAVAPRAQHPAKRLALVAGYSAPPLDERPPAQCWKPAFAPHLLPGLTGLREELRRYLRYTTPMTPLGAPRQLMDTHQWRGRLISPRLRGGPIAIIISSTAQWEVGIVTFRNQLVHQTGSDITSMA